MSQHEERDLSEFSMLDLFRMEADGQARTLTDGLLAIERGAGDAAVLESLMRAAHSIKGAAAIVGLDVVVQLAHGMEDAFVAAQHGQLQLTPVRVDVLLAGVDLVVQCSAQTEAGLGAWLGQHAARISAVLQAIAQLAQLHEAPLHEAPLHEAPLQEAPPLRAPSAATAGATAAAPAAAAPLAAPAEADEPAPPRAAA
ncbi:MAG: Hpt domain-containing protein, partial [Pseudomonadota bacterium]|nr:Hpt domain-containing protein [Pseudomonadota bacterium]